MPLYVDGTKIKKIVYRGTDIKKVYCNGTLVFNSDHVVTYQIKSQSWNATVEDGDNAAAVTNSNSIASEKMGSGDSFLGWTTTNGSKSPASTIICDKDNMTLYGIWKHTHIGSNNTKAGCYQGEALTYRPVVLTGSTDVSYDACGCRHQTWYWKCNNCGRTWSSTTNESIDCTQGHHLSDDGSASCPNGCSDSTTYAVSCGKSEGTFCG